MFCFPKGLNSFSREVNTLVKIRRNYTTTGRFLLLLDSKYEEDKTHRTTRGLRRSIKCLDIQYFGNVINVFQKCTALLHLTHPSLKAMRLHIT